MTENPTEPTPTEPTEAAHGEHTTHGVPRSVTSLTPFIVVPRAREAIIRLR